MPETPQAQRYLPYKNDAEYGSDDWYKNLASHYRKYRGHYPDLFDKKFTDYEIVENLRNNFSAFGRLSPPPTSMLHDHYDKKGIDYEKTFPQESNYIPRVTEENQDEVAGYDSTPDNFFERVGKRTLNESLAGMGWKIATGNDIWTEDNLEELSENQQMVEDALAFAGSMLVDGLFFWATGGVGAMTFKMAGKGVLSKATKEVAEAKFVNNVLMNPALIGQPTTQASKKALLKVVQKKGSGKTAAQIDKELAEMGVNKSLIQKIREESLEEAAEIVGKATATPQYIKSGLTKVDDVKLSKALPAPGVRGLMNVSGSRAALTLGSYNMVRNVEEQTIGHIAQMINPETGQPYGEDAPNILKAYKEGFSVPNAVEIDQVFWSGLHGIAGGYFAGALGGVSAAGRMGLLAKTDAFISKKVSSKIGDKIYNEWAGLVPEALGFTGIGSAIDKLHHAVDPSAPIDDRSFARKFVANMTLIGATKGYHKIWNKTSESVRGANEKLKYEASKRRREKNEEDLKTFEKALEEIEDSPENKVIREEIQKKIQEVQEKNEIEIAKITDLFDNVENILTRSGITKDGKLRKNKWTTVTLENGEKVKIPDITRGEWAEVKEAVEKVIEFTKKEGLATDIKDAPALIKILVDNFQTKGDKPSLWDRIDQEMYKLEQKMEEAQETYEKQTTPVEAPVEAPKSKKEKTVGEMTVKELEAAKLEAKWGDEAVDKTYKESSSKKQENKIVQQRTTNNERINNENIKAKKVILSSDTNTGRVNALKPAQSLAKWLAKNKKKSLLEADLNDVQEYLNSFKSDHRQRTNNINNRVLSWLGGTSKNPGINPKLRGRVEQPITRKKTAVELQAEAELKKKQGNLGVLTSEQHQSGRENVASTKYDGKVINIKNKSGKVSVQSEVFRGINYILGIFGKRQVAINKQPGGELIRASDVTLHKQYLKEAGKEIQWAEIRLVDKGTVKDSKQYGGSVVIPDAKINGINYYEVFAKLVNHHQKRLDSGKAKWHWETVTVGKESKRVKVVEEPFFFDINGKSLSKNKVKAIQVEGFNTTGVHTLRDSLYKLAAELDRITGNDWSTFAKKGMVEHKTEGVSEKNYGAGLGTSVGRAWSVAEMYNLVNKHLGRQSQKFTELLAPKGQQNIYDTLVSQKQKELNDVRQSDNPVYNKLKRELDTLKDLANRERQAQKYLQDPTNSLTGFKPQEESALRRQVREFVSKNKGIQVVFDKAPKEAGGFVQGIIDVTFGKADVSTLFHENTHRLESLVLATKNKKLIKIWERGLKDVEDYATEIGDKRWGRFNREYGKDVNGNPTPDRPAIEYLTQMSGEWAANKYQARGLKRIKFWMEEVWSQLKMEMGFGDATDVAKIYGGIAERGFDSNLRISTSRRVQKVGSGPFKYELEMNLLEPPGIIKVNRQSQKFRGTEADKKILDNVHKILKEKGVDTDPGTLQLIIEHLGLSESVTVVKEKGGNYRVEGLDILEADALYQMVQEQILPTRKDRKKTWNTLNRQAHVIERQRGVTTKIAATIKESLGIPQGSLKYASERQIKSYIDFVESHYSKKEPQHSFVGDIMARDFASKDSAFNSIMIATKHLTLPVSYILRKVGAKDIAQKIEDHYFTETNLGGIGMSYISSAARELGIFGAGHQVGRRKLENIPFILDPELIQGNLSGKKLKEFEKFRDNYERGLEDIKNGGKGTKESRAVKHIKDMFDFYWNDLITKGSDKIKNPRLREEWLQSMNKKYVEEYFTRRLTKDAKNLLNLDSVNYEKALEDVHKNIIENRLVSIANRRNKLEKQRLNEQAGSPEFGRLSKRISELRDEMQLVEKDARTPESKTYLETRNEATERVGFLLNPKQNIVKNKFLLERQGRLPNTLTNSKGKEIKTYETNFNKVVGEYIQSMSKFNASVKHFNEFTSVKGEYDLYGDTPLAIMREKMKDTSLGNYVQKSVERRIGLEAYPQTGIGNVLHSGLSYAGKASALMGLSSPLSGLKNLAIGTQMTLGINGMRAFGYGLYKALNPRNWREMQKLGAFETGTGELNIGPVTNFIMRNISFMTRTEHLNRVVGAYAGEFYARNIISQLRGEGWSLLNPMSKSRLRQILKSRFNLTEAEIAAVEVDGLAKPSGKKNEMMRDMSDGILEKIWHYSHIKSQGATGDPFLPQWAGHRNAKAATLFYRMAYSGTANIVNHVVKPLQYGNPFPMIRYMAAANLTGAALWALYEKVLGDKPPKMNESFKAQALQNMAKSETLGLASFLLNPYAPPAKGKGGIGWTQQVLLNDSIMQPAIVRNSVNLGTMLGGLIRGAQGKADLSLTRSTAVIPKFAKDSVVILGHLNKALTNKNTPFKTQIKNTEKFKKQWMIETFPETYNHKNATNIEIRGTSPSSQYYTMIREAFLNNDMDMAARYYMATWYYLYDNYRVMDGHQYFTPKEAQKRTNMALEGVIRNIDPLSDFPKNWRKQGYTYDPKKLFLKHLTKENRDIANNNSKIYRFRTRELSRKVYKLKKDYFKKYDDGLVEHMFPYPPDNPLNPPKWKPSRKARATK